KQLFLETGSGWEAGGRGGRGRGPRRSPIASYIRSFSNRPAISVGFRNMGPPSRGRSLVSGRSRPIARSVPGGRLFVHGLFISHHSADRGARTWCASLVGRQACAHEHRLTRVTPATGETRCHLLRGGNDPHPMDAEARRWACTEGVLGDGVRQQPGTH